MSCLSAIRPAAAAAQRRALAALVRQSHSFHTAAARATSMGSIRDVHSGLMQVISEAEVRNRVFRTSFSTGTSIEDFLKRAENNGGIDRSMGFTYRTKVALSTDKQLRDYYANALGSFRFGRMLEDLDAIAGVVALGWVSKPDVNCVTACVDSIRIRDLSSWSMTRDITYTGRLSWTGRSSMEVQVSATQEDDHGNTVMIVESDFVFVARTKDGNRSIPVPTLALDCDTEEGRQFEGGKMRQKIRLQNAAEGLNITIPTEEEQRHIHRMHLEGKSVGDWLPKDTHVNSASLIQMDERNLYGKMFGGAVMRRGYELAYIAAYLHNGQQHPHLYEVCDITFNYPIAIGSVLNLKARIPYFDAERGLAVASVDAEVAEKGATRITTVLNFVFRSKHSGRAIFPVKYNECMEYLSGRRLVHRILSRYE